jgi:fructose transport system permease protein
LERLRGLHNFLHENSTFAPVIVLVGSLVGFSLVIGSRFFDPYNLSLIIQQVTIIALVGSAQTLIILTAGIDLSVGAIMVIASIVMGRLAMESHVPVFVAIVVALLAGMGGGLVNGLLVAYIGLPPFIATLGTWNMYFAINLWYSGNRSIDASNIKLSAPALQWLGKTVHVLGFNLTYSCMFAAAVFLLLWYVLNRTAYGRHVHAVGDDIEAARLAGIRVRRVLVSVYVVSGLICAAAAWALIGRVGAVTPQAGYTSNLDSITAVVVGGTSLFGGRGAIVGTLVGALIVGVFRNGLALAGADVLWQQFAIGLLIVVAVAIDQWIRKVSA